jgi:hypothetical protein
VFTIKTTPFFCVCPVLLLSVVVIIIIIIIIILRRYKLLDGVFTQICLYYITRENCYVHDNKILKKLVSPWGGAAQVGKHVVKMTA